MNEPERLTGKKFGRWLVIGEEEVRKLTPGGDRVFWECRCDCGVVRLVRIDGLITGGSQSCGCLQKEIAREIRIRGNKARALPKGEGNFNSVWRVYRKHALDKGLEFTLTKEEFRSIAIQPCYYCGDEPKQVYSPGLYNGDFAFTGVDRMNNDKGYTMDNCVPCCTICNLRKSDCDPIEFLKWAERVYLHCIRGRP